MWKPRPEDNKPMNTNPTQPAQPVPPPAAVAAPSISTQHKETPKASDPHRADVGHIGKSVQIKGELTGSEDLYLDGSIEGTVDLRDHSLIIGPNGKIKAGISARDLVVHGRVEGNVTATGRVELRKSCTLIGDVSTQRRASQGFVDRAFAIGEPGHHHDGNRGHGYPDPRSPWLDAKQQACRGAQDDIRAQ